MNEEDLLAVRNFGEKSLQELRERLILKRFLPNPRKVGGTLTVDADELDDEPATNGLK